jgi:hypothetical protein
MHSDPLLTYKQVRARFVQTRLELEGQLMDQITDPVTGLTCQTPAGGPIGWLFRSAWLAAHQ